MYEIPFQVSGVVSNKLLKANVTKNMTNGWLVNPTLLTPAGNMYAPPRREIVKWIPAAWNGLGRTMIINSFKSCALKVAVDRSEDGHIHCFKENQPCMQG